MNIYDFDLTQLYTIAGKIVELYRTNIKNSGVTASGALENFTWNFTFNGNSFILEYRLPEHWKYIEEGRKPTSANKTKWNDPIGDILRWIRLKRIVPRPTYRIDSKGNRKQLMPTDKQLAYMIVRKIHKEGFYSPNHQGKHLLKNSLDTAKQNGLIDQLVNEISKQLTNNLRIEIKEIFK